MADKDLRVHISANDKASDSIRKVRSEIDQLGKSAGGQKLKQGIDSISTQLERTKQQFVNLFIGLPSLGLAVGGFTRLAGTAKEVEARLRLAAESAADFTRSQQFAAETAISTARANKSIAGVYSKLRINVILAIDDVEKLSGLSQDFEFMPPRVHCPLGKSNSYSPVSGGFHRG